MSIQTNPQLQLAFDFLQYTNQNVFLTGKAGTGKTTFLHNLKRETPKRMIVVAPTGVAAINAGGVTIHSFFQISFGPQIPHDPNKPRAVEVSANGAVAASVKRFNREKINIIRSLDLLVIDEISMVRADLLDAIDEVLRRYRNKYQPFGGVQLLMIGDLQQLAPVVKDDEWEILKPYYDTCYFFSSRALRQSRFVGIELTHIFRQSDKTFIHLLNQVRENRIDAASLRLLNDRYVPNFAPKDNEGYITLTTHNYQSQQINEQKLEQLRTKRCVFDATVEGEFPEYAYPTDFQLALKVGAQVMFVKNDPSPEKRFYNGKIGKITSIDEQVHVLCPGETEPIEVIPTEWQNAKYALNEKTQEIDENVIGKFTQFPLKLAWAITIHKSQGLTFERAIIDARLSFAHGQVYVALSRCKTLEGLVLRSQINDSCVKSDTTVIQFTNKIENNQPGSKELEQSKKEYQVQLVSELFDFLPIQRTMQHIVKTWNENSTVLVGNLANTLTQCMVQIQTELVAVAGKFLQQVRQLVDSHSGDSKNLPLEERLALASEYYLSKTTVLIEEPLTNSTFDTNNKEIKKSISEALQKLGKEIEVKKACFNEVKNGFDIKRFLQVKSKAQIEPTHKMVGTKASIAEQVGISHPAFYKMLLAWRAEKAEQRDEEIAHVLPQKTLLKIAAQIPATGKELKEIKGMGGVRIKQYGKELLQMAIAFRKEYDLPLPIGVEKEVKQVGQTTHQKSFDLFLKGLSIPQIAKEREMAVSTIEGHLCYFIARNQLDVATLVSKEKIVRITEYYKKNDDVSFGVVKQALGADISYGEIKMVKASIGM